MSLKVCLASALLPLILLTNCKKGADDPAFSFRTRKARVAGDWHIESGSAGMTSKSKNAAPYSQRFVLNSSELTMTETYQGGIPTIYKGIYSLNVKFEKDGNFDMVEALGVNTLRAKGTWRFTSKGGDEKNKESIVIELSEITSGTTYHNLFNRFGTVVVYHIKELRDKRMVLECSNNLDLSINENDTRFSSNFTLIQ